MRPTALELHQRGVDAANSRRFAAARRALNAAAARTEDPDLHARIAGTMSYVLAQTGEPDAARRLCGEAMAAHGVSARTRAVLGGQLGVLLVHDGRAAEAEELLTIAVDDLDDDSVERASCLMNRSTARMQLHDLAGATTDLEAVTGLYERLGMDEARAEAQHNLGYAALLGGDLVRALALMSASRPVFAALSEMSTAIADLDRAEVLRDAGMVGEAEALLAEVAVRFGAQRMRQARGEAEFHLARARLHHDTAAAVRTARRARRRFEALGSEGWAARAAAVELDARRRSGRMPSREDYAETVRRLRRLGLRTEASAVDIAARLVDDRPVRIPRNATTPVRLRAYEVRALRALRAGRVADARRLAGEGLELFAGWQRAFGALDLQASVTMHGTDLLLAGLTAAERSDDPEVVFEWAEHARHLGHPIVPVRPPHDPSLADDLAELRMLRADLAGGDWTADPRVRAARDRVRERQWRSTAAGAARDRVSLPDLQARLGDDAAMVTWLYTTEALCAVVATSDAASVVRLRWDDIRPLLDGLRADLDAATLVRGSRMAAVVERSFADRAARLDDALLRPILERAPDAARLVLTVPGVLGGIPWALLPSLERTPFTLATSASRWIASVSRPLQRVGAAAGPRVARAESEVRAVASAHPVATMLGGAAATVGAVTALAGDVDLLHVAAHGRHSADNPMFSGLELADGTLFGYDVDLIGTVPDTVVLSACELGRSAVRWHEEALGMTRVWLHAGVRCVIASPVLVPDDVAAELLPEVHRMLAAGVAPAVALSDAAAETGIRAPLHCHGDGF